LPSTVKKKKAKRVWNAQNFFIALLRSKSYMLPNVKAALAAAKVGIGRWRCAICGKHLVKGEYARDHIQPVIAITGFVDWNTYIERFMGPIQIICKSPCHAEKTKSENALRRKYAKEK
jgi:hypothetical protein